jgi:hypothetical protein
MATVVRIKAGVVVDGELDLPLPTQGIVRGTVRMWYEVPGQTGVPQSKSNKWIVIGEDIGPTSGPVSQRYGQDIRSGDVARVGGWETLLSERGLSLDDYLDPNHTFSADLALPASLVDAYTG